MIAIEELGCDRDAALIVLAEARRLAPCLDSLMGDDLEVALAILRRAGKRSAAIVSTLKTRSAGDWTGTRFSPAEIGDVFVANDRATLQSLCGASPSTAGVGPRGSFPPPSPRFRP